MSHANARLTPHGRFLLVRRVIDDERPVAHVAKELGVSRQCAHRWVNRYRDEGHAGLSDRTSRPHTSPTRTDPATEQRVITARQELRAGPDSISDETGVPARTVTRILTRHDIPPLVALDPLTGEQIRATRIQRVMTDNAFAYRKSLAFRAAVAAVGARQKFTRPHCPWTNGKVERFNRTLGAEWAYRQVFISNAARADALAPWLMRYNTTRPHHALGRRAPITRLPVTNVSAEYS